MKTLKIHRYENPKWGRYHLPLFKKLDNYFSQFFELEILNYTKDDAKGPISLRRNLDSKFGRHPTITDVEYVLENEEGELKVVSATEYYNNYVSHFAKSPNCSRVLLSHFNWHNLYFWAKREGELTAIRKVKPWIFLPYSEFDVARYRQIRQSQSMLNPKLFWKGCGADDYRKTILYLHKFGDMQDIHCTGTEEEYLLLLSKSQLAVSFYTTLSRYRTPFDYPGEFCYRDMEYQLLGVPYIRIEYKDTLHNPLLPNHHYISIPREEAYVAFEKRGDLGVAELYQKVYKEVIGDKEFLNFISENQINWSNANLLNGNAEKLTFDLLGLCDWL